MMFYCSEHVSATTSAQNAERTHRNDSTDTEHELKRCYEHLQGLQLRFEGIKKKITENLFFSRIHFASIFMELVPDLKCPPKASNWFKTLLHSVRNVLSTNKASLYSFKGVRQLHQNLENTIYPTFEG